MALVDQNGKPIVDEIASIAKDITYPAFLGVLRNRDDTLLTRGGGGPLALKIYDDIERDCHAYAVLHKRKMAVIARPWEVQAASTSRADKKAADMVSERLKSFEFDLFCYNLLDAILKGYAVGEIMWDIQGSEIGISEVIQRDQRRFTFGLQRELRMLTFDDFVRGEQMPDRKFVVHSFGSKDGNPFGLGLGTRLFWPAYFKRKDITFWLTFADKFGSPTMMGTYQQGSTTQKNELLAAMAAIAQDAGIAIPEGVVISLLESAKSGSTDTYEKMAKYMDEQMSEAVLGETMTTNGRGSGGLNAGGMANVHNEVRMELVQADSDLLSGAVNKTVSRWLTEFNMPGAAPPTIRRIVEEQQDLLQRAQRDAVLFSIGKKLDDETFAEVYGDGYVDVPPAAPSKPELPAPGSGQSFAEGHVDPMDALVNEAISGWQADLAPAADAIQKLMDESASRGETAQQFLERLPSLLRVGGQLDAKLTHAAFVSRVAGDAGIDPSDGR